MSLNQAYSVPQLSSRGQNRVDSLGASSADRKLFHPEKNPDGLISLSTAENSLMSNKLLKFIHENFHLERDHLKYRRALLHGFTLNSTQIMPKILNKTLKPYTPIEPEHIAIGPGIGAVFAHLLWHLCEAGDGVVLTAVTSYTRDIIYPAQAVPIIVPVPADVDPLSPAAIPFLRQYMKHQLEIEHQRLSVLILCNPHNPLARAYPKETIIEYARIAEEFNLHLIVDEVFANEIFASRYVPEPLPFTSILSFPSSSLPCNPSRIHVLWSPSKDLGASGLKIGAMISQNTLNKPLMDTIRTSVKAAPVSSASDAIFTAIMGDEEFLDGFLEENRRTLREAFEMIARWCEGHELGFEKAQAGPFIMIDFGRIIRALTLGSDTDSDSKSDSKKDESKTIQAKAELAIQMMEKGGIELETPSVYADPMGTRIRVVFTLPQATMKVALRRIETIFKLHHVEL